MQARLETKLVRKGRHVVANVKDGDRDFRFTFGSSCSLKHIWQQIPRLVEETLFEERIRNRYTEAV
jgi:hypothetical protein